MNKHSILPDFDPAGDWPRRSPPISHCLVRDTIYQKLRQRGIAAASPLWRPVIAGASRAVLFTRGFVSDPKSPDKRV